MPIHRTSALAMSSVIGGFSPLSFLTNNNTYAVVRSNRSKVLYSSCFISSVILPLNYGLTEQSQSSLHLGPLLAFLVSTSPSDAGSNQVHETINGFWIIPREKEYRLDYRCLGKIAIVLHRRISLTRFWTKGFQLLSVPLIQ